ncbi:MAG: hypothetical protein IPN71_03210 [Fibrobacteres bacterium]|nr:hypothetical protein [Fibrobacterota bacterium]
MEQKPSTALSRLAASRGITLPTVPKASPTAAPSRLVRRPEVEGNDRPAEVHLVRLPASRNLPP